MLAYAIALGVAIIVVPLTGGRFTRLAHLRFHRSWMLFAGLGLQVALELVPFSRDRIDDVGFALLIVSYVLILGFGLSNLLVTGMGVITVGIALNAFVIALNGGMPYTVAEGIPREVTVKHRPERPDDILPVLSDRIVVRDPFNIAISFGDLIIAVGLVDLTYRNSRRPRRRIAHDDETAAALAEIDLSALEFVSSGARADEPTAFHYSLERGEHADVVDVTRT